LREKKLLLYFAMGAFAASLMVSSVYAISLVAQPQTIQRDQTTHIIYCQGGLGCNYPVNVFTLTVTGPDGTIYKYNLAPFTLASGSRDIPFGTGQPDWTITFAGVGCAGFTPLLGGGSNTHCPGDYVIISIGSDGQTQSIFIVLTDFAVSVPMFSLGAGIAVSIGFLGVIVMKRRFFKAPIA